MRFPSWATKSGGLGLLTAAIGAVGVIKTIAELGSGTSFSIQKVAYYIGASTMAVYGGVGVGFMAMTIVVLGLSYVSGHGDDPPEAFVWPGLAVGIVVAVAMIYGIITGGALIYEEVDGFGRAVFAGIGVAAVVGGIYLSRKWHRESQATEL